MPRCGGFGGLSDLVAHGFQGQFLCCTRHRGFNQTGQYRRHIQSRKHRNLRRRKHAYCEDVRLERRRRIDSGIHSTIARHLLGRRWWPLAGRIVQVEKAKQFRR